nr:MAG TPA: hypothetical protein [Bacteriophage sp.]
MLPERSVILHLPAGRVRSGAVARSKKVVISQLVTSQDFGAWVILGLFLIGGYL